MVGEWNELFLIRVWKPDPILVGEWNELFLIRVWKPLLSMRVLKTVRLMAICNRPKRIISASGGFGLLQYGRCTNKDARPPRRVDCEITHLLEKGTKYSL